MLALKGPIDPPPRAHAGRPGGLGREYPELTRSPVAAAVLLTQGGQGRATSQPGRRGFAGQHVLEVGRGRTTAKASPLTSTFGDQRAAVVFAGHRRAIGAGGHEGDQVAGLQRRQARVRG